ncbi:MAG: O-antigen ligase family protein [Caulobacterales bacterium]|nr:O-antigen ligase family protein [Caulobacterales bacterium]
MTAAVSVSDPGSRPMLARLTPPLVFFLFLIPFAYSDDNDLLRAPKVVLVGVVALCFGFVMAGRYRVRPEMIFLMLYGALLTLQQLVIPNGDLVFGLQYAVVMVAAFLPALTLAAVPWDLNRIERLWDLAIRVITVVIVVNSLLSRLFGLGETFSGSGGRYFGYLGDSISPVIVFPTLYFILSRRLLWAGACLLALWLTGGKAALVMLGLGLLLIPLTRFRPFVVILGLIAFVVIGLWLYPTVASVLESDHLVYSWNTRLLSYEIGWRHFQDSPVWGVGINQSMIGLQAEAQNLAGIRGMTRYWDVGQVQNSFLRTLAETGTIGFVLLLSFCGLLIIRALKTIRTARRHPRSNVRSIAIAGACWTVAFITSYQGVGWFEHVHPLFAWLLLFSAASTTAGDALQRYSDRAAQSRATMAREQAMRQPSSLAAAPDPIRGGRS